MFKKNSKILCYVLVFDQLDIIKSSLNFLIKYSDILELIVIENPSKKTPEIKKFIDSLGNQGHIKRYYLFAENITNNAFDVVVNLESKLIKRSPYIILTDGDLVPDSAEWLQEEIDILKDNKEIFACGISLDKSNLPLKTFPSSINWIPDDIAVNKKYIEARTGAHLLAFRGKEFNGFMDWKKDKNLALRDGTLHQYCYKIIDKKWARTKNAKAYHLTWDLYRNKKHPYTMIKTEKSFLETWSHQRNSEYKVTTY